MKERELRERATCSMCGQKIGASGLPIFWTVEVKQYAIDPAAAKRQHGLGMMLGAELAMHMGPDEDLAKVIGEPADLTVCVRCVTIPTFVAELAEKSTRGGG